MAKQNNQEKALSALLESTSIVEAAGKSGLSERTLYRFLEDEKFQTEYQQARSRIVESAISRLELIAGDAVETLHRNLTCDNPQAEIRAAQLILDNVFGNGDGAKQPTERQIVISFNFNNSVKINP